MSREAELYKDKIEVSLDGRQIFYLFFGGAVIVGLVFVLGVMVGRRVEARGHVDRARVAASVDPLAALDRLEGGADLSFHGALRGAEGPASDVEKQIAAMQKSDAKPDAKASAAKQSVAAAKPEAKAEPKPDKAEPKAKVEAPAKAEPEADTADKTAKAEPTADGDGAVTKAPEDKKPAEDKPKFTLQLSSFQDKQEAEAYLASVKSAGYQAYVTEGAVDGKHYYRVRMGTYRSMDAANEAKADFEKSANKAALVTRL